MSGFTAYAAEQIMAGAGLPQTLYARLHTGDPGANGVLNIAAESTRPQVDLTPGPESYDAINDADIVWPGPHPATESCAWLVLMDAAIAGNAWVVCSVSAQLDLVVGGSSQIDAGNLRLTFQAHS